MSPEDQRKRREAEIAEYRQHKLKAADERIDKPETLQDFVRLSHAYSARKHGLCRATETPLEYADDQIDRLSNSEFLAELSEGLSRYLKKLKDDEL